MNKEKSQYENKVRYEIGFWKWPEDYKNNIGPIEFYWVNDGIYYMYIDIGLRGEFLGHGTPVNDEYSESITFSIPDNRDYDQHPYASLNIDFYIPDDNNDGLGILFGEMSKEVFHGTYIRRYALQSLEDISKLQKTYELKH